MKQIGHSASESSEISLGASLFSEMSVFKLLLLGSDVPNAVENTVLEAALDEDRKGSIIFRAWGSAGRKYYYSPGSRAATTQISHR